MQPFLKLILIVTSVLSISISAQNSEKAKSAYDKGRKAYLKFTTDDYQEAIKYFDQAVEADAEMALAYAGLAEAYALLGYEMEKNGQPAKNYYEKALDNAKKAVGKGPKFGATHRALAQAFMIHDAKKYGQEIYEALKVATELDSTDAESYYLMWLHTENDKPESPLIQKSLRLNEHFFQSQYGVGLAYSKLKKFDQAVERFKKAVAINPKNYLPYYSMGNAYSQMKKYDLAIPEYEQTLKLNKNIFDVYFYLGLACYYQDQNKKAVKHLEKYLELVPASPYRAQVENILKDIK
ncbi:tetratricopeptide repeat protein [bacterium]|nr:tetratricopeptide repeat protein [bacterium]